MNPEETFSSVHVKAGREEVDANGQYKAPMIQIDRAQAPSRHPVTGPVQRLL